MSGAVLRPVGGDGVLSRHGALVVLCSADDAADEVLAAHEEVAHAKGDATQLADRIAAVLDGKSGVSAVAFGPTGSSVLVAVFGHAWMDATTVHGEQRLALKAGNDGVRSTLPGALVSIKAGLGDPQPGAEPHRWGNLEHGVTYAGGLLFVAGDDASAAPAPPAPLAEPEPAAVSAPAPMAEPEPEPEPDIDSEPAAEPELESTAALSLVDEPTSALIAVDEPEADEPAPETVSWPVGEPVGEPVGAPIGLTKHAAPEEPAALEPEPAPEPEMAAEPPAAEEPPSDSPARPPLTLDPLPAEGTAAPPTAPEPPAEPPQPELLMPPPTSPVPPPVEPPQADVDRSRPFESVLLLPAAGELPATEDRVPLPVASAPQAPPAPEVAPPAHPAEDHGVQVLGVYCKNGHFNDPAARYCAVCGISMAQLTLVPRPGPRPPLGVLVLDDGSIFSLETDYVIGRDPAKDSRVADGSARPLRLEDPKGLISRAHLQIKLDGWQVQVVDLGSANGTGVFAPGDSAWQPAPRLTPVTIRPGTQVGFGQRQLRFESHTNT